MYRVVLVDDEGEFRAELRALLERSEDFQVVGEAGSGAEAIRLLAHVTPDLVIADVNMPDGDGLDVARHVLGQLPGTKVILVSGYSRGYERLAKDEGVSAFIPKSRLSPEALLQALQPEA